LAFFGLPLRLSSDPLRCGLTTKSQLAIFAADKKKAEDLVHAGVQPVDPSVDVTRMAALSNVAAAVMNSPDAYSIH
jgi:hypothetical protein